MAKEKISYTGHEEADFIEEDERSEKIKSMTDPEEVQATQELFEEKYAEPGEDTSAGSKEPDKTDTSETDPPDKTDDKSEEPKKEEKTETDETPKKEDGSDADAPSEDDEFKLTDEFIKDQPEENREILSKYAGKGKEDIAKAAANAIAMKNEYLKGNEKAIEAVQEKLLELPEEELLSKLIDSSREVGVSDTPPEPDQPAEVDIELPTLPQDDEQVQAILQTEIVKRMKKIYPDMPDDMNSPEYMEWEREVQDASGLSGVEKLLNDRRRVSSEVTNQLQTVVYAEENLSNLYNESPNEIVQYINEENLPKLKHLNDNYVQVNNTTLAGEVESIKTELSKYGLTPKDIGVDLTLTPDAEGNLFNKNLNEFMYSGDDLDPNVVGIFGKIPILKKGTLVSKFIQANNPLILTNLSTKKVESEKVEREKLKDETLNTVTSQSSGSKGTHVLDPKDTTNPDQVKKLMDEIESKYD